MNEFTDNLDVDLERIKKSVEEHRQGAESSLKDLKDYFSLVGIDIRGAMANASRDITVGHQLSFYLNSNAGTELSYIGQKLHEDY